jgi:protein-disulfide isomerase|tara:strand:+ start:52 stop:639 length:588 start_codon:yes stop_codon:yes gene_type:complete
MKSKIFKFIAVALLIFNISHAKTEDFPYYGKVDPEPKIIIKVFSSFTCPYCADLHINYLPNIIEKFVNSGQAAIKLMDYPLDLPALKAAQIAKCFPNEIQLKYIDEIYLTQSEWTQAKTLSDLLSNLEKIAAKQGLGEAEFKKCANDKKSEDVVLKSRIDGQSKYEINSTPTLIINEKKFNGTFNELEGYLKKLL